MWNIGAFIYLVFSVAFNTVQVISRRVVGRAEETSTYSLLGFCTVNCRPTASNYQLSHLRPCWGTNPGLRGGRRECYHSAPVAPGILEQYIQLALTNLFNCISFLAFIHTQNASVSCFLKNSCVKLVFPIVPYVLCISDIYLH